MLDGFRERLSSLVVFLQVTLERLPGRRSDQLVATLLIGLSALFAALTFSSAPVTPARAISSDRPDARGLYRFDGKPVSHEWRWLLSLSRQAGWKGKLNSAVRSWRQQDRLHRRFLEGRGAPAFPADGPSRHMQRNAPEGWQHAVDVTYPKRLMQIASDAGVELDRPYPSEPWHLEATGPFGDPSP